MNQQWTALSRRVEEAIGEPLPDTFDPSSVQCRRILGRLRDVNPALNSEVMDAVSGTSVRLPAEDEAQADQARRRVVDSLVGRFLRPDGLRTGAKRFNLRKTINYVGAAAAVAVIIWSVLPKGNPPGPPSLDEKPPAATQPAQRPAQPPTPPAASDGLFTSPPLASTPASPVPAQPDMLSVPGIPGAPPADAPSVPVPPLPEGSAGAMSPSVPSLSSGGVIVYEAGRQRELSVVYQQDRAEGGPRPDQVVVYPASAASPLPPQAPAADTQTAAQPSSVIVYQQPPAAAADQSSPDANGAVPSALPRRGSLLTARLVNPVAVAAPWGLAPVLAEVVTGGPEGAVLFGSATLASTGVINITFTRLLTAEGKEIPINAAAYDPAVGRIGVGGTVATMMPGAAAAARQAGLSAISDYAGKMAQQNQATITNEFLTITQGTPDFWYSLAASIAKAFSPATNAVTGPTVVTRIDRGAIIAAMVL